LTIKSTSHITALHRRRPSFQERNRLEAW